MSSGNPFDSDEPKEDIPEGHRYQLPDMRVGDPNGENPLKKYTWPELRAIMYGDEDPAAEL